MSARIFKAVLAAVASLSALVCSSSFSRDSVSPAWFSSAEQDVLSGSGIVSAKIVSAKNRASDHADDFERVKDSRGSNVETYSRCSPVRWYLQKELSPPWALGLLKRDFATLSSLTGLSFVYGGVVSGVPDPGFSPPAGLSVAFVEKGSLGVSGSISGSKGKVAGRTRLWMSKDAAGLSRIVSSVVLYDLSAASFLSRASEKDKVKPGPRMWQPLLLHELGHAVGLGHARSIDSLMYPFLRPRLRSFQKGDVLGLSDIRASNLLSVCP